MIFHAVMDIMFRAVGIYAAITKCVAVCTVTILTVPVNCGLLQFSLTCRTGISAYLNGIVNSILAIFSLLNVQCHAIVVHIFGTCEIENV